MTSNGSSEQRAPIAALRVFTGEDGQTHVEPFEFELGLGGSPSLSELVPVTGVYFRRTPPDLDADWHPAPRRQFVVTIKGEGEIVTSDGTVLALGPGSIVLVEDTDGIGHITRGKGSEDRLSLFIPIPDDWQPPAASR